MSKNLKRKIEATLSRWKTDPNRKPLVLKGVRQCGKTYSVLKFAQENYKNVVYLNFYERPELANVFSGSLVVDELQMRLSVWMPDLPDMIPHKTVIILDEIQQCPDARTALKFFKIDGRYDVIATGSLLGVSGYSSDITSVPVGYETLEQMVPMDFEEFLWANGISEDATALLRTCLSNEVPVPDWLHDRMRDLFRQYIVVGGMPEVVSTFVSRRNFSAVEKIQRDLLESYRADMIKYADKQFKNRIRECYDSIPAQLGRENNKKFMYSVVQKGARGREYRGALQWIEDAGMICRCYNLNITGLPLDGNAISDCFKVYTTDIGLFVAMLEKGTVKSILQGDLSSYKGAIFENAAADVFHKMGRKLYYFHKDSGLEVDFVIRWRGECVLVEAKATTGNVKSTKSILKMPSKYNVSQAIKLGDYNVGRSENNILTLPFYMAFLLTEE